MNIILHKIASGLVVISLAITGLFGIQAPVESPVAQSGPAEQAIGSAIPKGVASFQSSLASGIQTTDTSMTLVSFTTRDGTELTTGTLYGFVIDQGTSLEEYVSGIASTSKTITSLSRGLSVFSGTTTIAASKKRHNRGASVKSTDAPVLLVASNILNGDDTLPNVISYTAGVGCTAGSAQTAICSKAYMDALAIQGVATSTESTTGIVRLATKLQQASSTDSGVNTPLVLQAKNATSTPYSGSNLNVVVTQNNGKIHQGFLDLTQGYTWSGLHNFTGSILSTASSTFTATTSITANAAAKLCLNQICYVAPSADGSASQALKTSGAGVLSWGAVPSTILSTTTNGDITGSTAETAFFATTTIPGGTLGTSGTIKGRAYLSFTNKAAGNVAIVRFKYNNSLLGSLNITSLDNNDGNVVVTFDTIASGATNSQETNLYRFGDGAISATTSVFSLDNSTAVDSTANQGFVMTGQLNNSVTHIILKGIQLSN